MIKIGVCRHFLRRGPNSQLVRRVTHESFESQPRAPSTATECLLRKRAVSRVRRAGLAAGHGVRAAGHTLYTAETAFRDQKSLRRHWPRLISDVFCKFFTLGGGEVTPYAIAELAISPAPVN